MPLRTLAQNFSPAVWAVIGFVFLAFSINDTSIDLLESQTWYYARLENVGEFCNELRKDDNKVSQMPLGIFSAWAWSRAFGTSELAMRSLNLLWAAVALGALAIAGRQISIPWLPALFAIQPFVWSSMNAARTPVMEMAGGSLLLLGMIGCLRRRPVGGVGSLSLCLGAILLTGASLQGLFPLAAVLTGLTVNGLWDRLRWRKREKIFLFITGGFLALLGAYYLWVFLREGAGSQLWKVSPANILFVCYEFLGFQGFGPGRQDLRAVMKGILPVRDFLIFLPGILVFAAAYLGLFAAAFKSWATRDLAGAALGANRAPDAEDRINRPSLLKTWFLCVGVVLQSLIVLYAVALISGFAFWGRHLAGAFPFWVAAVAVTLFWAKQGLWRRLGRRAGLAVLLLLTVSTLFMRFATRHANDDYRGAVAEAVRQSAAGSTVWWVADYSGGSYYGLPLTRTMESGTNTVYFAADSVSLPATLPDTIIISRPDTFDHFGAISKLLASGAYTKRKSLQAFEVWERKPR